VYSAGRWLLYILDYNMSIAVWVGIDLAHAKWRKKGKLNSLQSLKESVMYGAVVTSTILELVIYPAIYMIWRGRQLRAAK
jgi:Cu(I)/Ag(I) efflux system membrane protein CusA/SilA